MKYPSDPTFERILEYLAAVIAERDKWQGEYQEMSSRYYLEFNRRFDAEQRADKAARVPMIVECALCGYHGVNQFHTCKPKGAP